MRIYLCLNKKNNMEKKAIFDLHTEAREWKNRLDFFRDDLMVMENRISEIETRNNAKEVLAFVEHFQNQLILQREQLDILEKEVRNFIQSIDEEVRKNPVAAEHRKKEDDGNLRERVETFERLFQELRQELLRFVAKWI